MKYFWTVPQTPEDAKQRPRVHVPADERRSAEEWMRRHGDDLPNDDTGRDLRVSGYEFSLHQTNELGDDLDDRDGVTFAGETFQEFVPEQKDTGTLSDEEKTRAYDGLESTLDKVAEQASDYPSLESSGPLASSWRLVEKTLGSFYRGGSENVTPQQWLRLEKANPRPVRKQWKNGHTDLKLRKVWDAVSEQLVKHRLKTFYPTRATTRMAWDEVSGTFHEVPFVEFNPHDPEGLEAERRHVEKKSPRPVGSLPDLNELVPAKPVTYPTGTARDWKGESDPAYRDWCQSGDYDSLLHYREIITPRASVKIGQA